MVSLMCCPATPFGISETGKPQENVRRRMARFPGSRMQITSAPGSGTQVTLVYGKQGKNEGDPG